LGQGTEAKEMTSKEAYRRYNQSKKGWWRKLRYRNSPKGQETIVAWNKAHPNYYRDWFLAHPHYQMERYHRIQEEYGSHSGDITGILYVGRFVRALETAEIVEIKIEPEKGYKKIKRDEDDLLEPIK